MRPATSVEQVLAAPVGQYLIGGFYLNWVYSPSLIRTVYFGRPSTKDFPALLPLFDLSGHPALRAPYDVLVDCRRLEALSPDALEFLLRYLETARRFSARMHRVAIVRPSGHAGFVMAGVFYELVRSSFTAALFADAAEAASWLDNKGAAKASAELDRLVDGLRGTPPELLRLQELLQSDLRRPSLERAAAGLGIPSRTLQRLLKENGTGFRSQLGHARVRLAERLLCDHDVKLEAIARQVGYSTLAHFIHAFRRATGESPGEFRRRRRS